MPIVDVGFSPYELLYGRPIKGPLGIVFENWWEDEEAQVPQNVVNYMLTLRDRLEDAMAIVSTEKQKVPLKNKQWYDKKARQVKYNVGDDVLVLQLLAGKPLDQKRVGLYKVIKQIFPVDYLTEFPNTRKPQRVIHANLLRKYVHRTDNISVVNAHDWDDDEAMTLVPPRDEGINEQLLGEETAHLEPAKAEQMCNLIRGYNSVISDKSGCTDVVVHDIKLKPNSQPVNQKPYLCHSVSKKCCDTKLKHF